MKKTDLKKVRNRGTDEENGEEKARNRPFELAARLSLNPDEARIARNLRRRKLAAAKRVRMRMLLAEALASYQAETDPLRHRAPAAIQ